jgi:formiminoglutamase
MKTNFEFIPFTQKSLSGITSIRSGEVKLGEKLQTLENGVTDTAKYFILGISEDIGPQSNGGFSGSTGAFKAFVKRFANIQSNQFLNGENTIILGEIISNTIFQNLETGRMLIEELDLFVESIIAPLVQQGLIPIVIGGGHNNAFPIIKTISKSIAEPISVINFDPHADFRPREGRHSGNPFSYAHNHGFLKKYAILGLHQSYNSQFILDQLTDNSFLFSFFDDYLSKKADFETDLTAFYEHISSDKFGIELDLDSIAYMPSSAFSPSGMSVEEARSYVLQMAQSRKVQYLHLPEAAPKNEIEEVIVGKTLAYLVSDFMKANQAAQ